MPLFPEWARLSPGLRVKRLVDLIVCSSVLTVAGPLLAGVGILVRSKMGSPVIFRQSRPGYMAVPFTLLKFRTMREPRDNEIWFRSDELRLTNLGRIIRKLSIDELPSLWNVVRGEMSLVGPRPLLNEYVPKYTAVEMRRHEMPPGITGWAQVNGRQEIPFSRRLELDVWYVENWSLGLDLRILWLTVLSVVRGVGVHSGQDVEDVDDIGLSSDVPRQST